MFGLCVVQRCLAKQLAEPLEVTETDGLTYKGEIRTNREHAISHRKSTKSASRIFFSSMFKFVVIYKQHKMGLCSLNIDKCSIWDFAL